MIASSRPLIFLTALVCSTVMAANADSFPSDVQFLEISVESELQEDIGGRPLYAINYMVLNAGDETLIYLMVAIIGLDEDQQIVEIADRQIFYSSTLPQGFAPSGEIVQRHGLELLIQMRQLFQ